jgi:hypothetical protein
MNANERQYRSGWGPLRFLSHFFPQISQIIAD